MLVSDRVRFDCVVLACSSTGVFFGGRVEIATRPSSSSLMEFPHGAFASKNIRAPEENACTAG